MQVAMATGNSLCTPLPDISGICQAMSTCTKLLLPETGFVSTKDSEVSTDSATAP